eukprot:SAG31_NODE_276_length_18650_cov_5.821842_5_plen_239_part_00
MCPLSPLILPTPKDSNRLSLQRIRRGLCSAEAAAASAAAAAAGSTVSERDSHASLSLVVDDGVNKSDAEDRAEHTTKAKLQSDAALLKAQATVAHLTTELTKAKAAEVDLIKAKDAEYTARYDHSSTQISAQCGRLLAMLAKQQVHVIRIVADKEAKSLARQLAKSEEKVVEYAGALVWHRTAPCFAQMLLPWTLYVFSDAKSIGSRNSVERSCREGARCIGHQQQARGKSLRPPCKP